MGSTMMSLVMFLLNLIAFYYTSCEWANQPCLAENFTTHLTDFGLCHSFNFATDDNDKVTSNHTGNSFM